MPRFYRPVSFIENQKSDSPDLLYELIILGRAQISMNENYDSNIRLARYPRD